MFGWFKAKVNTSLTVEVEPAKPAIRDEAYMLARLMRNEADWDKGNCVWYHPVGVSVWVGNSDIGFSVVWNSKDRNHYNSLSDDGWKSTKRMNLEEYKHILAAYNNVIDMVEQEAIRAVAQRIVERYCQQSVESIVAPAIEVLQLQ